MDFNLDKLDIVFSKLKILGKLEPGEKIIIKDGTIDVVDFSTFNLARIQKWYRHETRVSIRQKLKQFFRYIEDLTQTFLTTPPNFLSETDLNIILDRLQKDLCNSTRGIHNLIATYNEDKTTRSELETILERIQIVVKKITTYLGQETAQADTPPPEVATELLVNIPDTADPEAVNNSAEEPNNTKQQQQRRHSNRHDRRFR